MSKKLFTDDEMLELKASIYVVDVIPSHVFFSAAFKSMLCDYIDVRYTLDLPFIKVRVALFAHFGNKIAHQIYAFFCGYGAFNIVPSS